MANECATNTSPSSDEPYECTTCAKTFSYKKTLARHIRNKHSDVGKPCVCEFCLSRFNDKWAMNKHIESTHTKKHHVVICPICGYKDSKIMIDMHFAKAHNITMEEENHRFTSLEEFEKWKNKTEKSTIARFVVNQKFRKKNGAERIIYNCHRSGFFKPRGKNKRKIKSQGTNKISGFCPARLEFEAVEKDEILVQFVKTHVGHDNDAEKVFSQYQMKGLHKKPAASQTRCEPIIDVSKLAVIGDYCEILNGGSLTTISEIKPILVKGFTINNNVFSILRTDDRDGEETIDEGELHSATVINVSSLAVNLESEMNMETNLDSTIELPDLEMNQVEFQDLSVNKVLAVRVGLQDKDKEQLGLSGPVEFNLEHIQIQKSSNSDPPTLSIPEPPDLQLLQDKEILIERFRNLLEAVESRELLWEMKKICIPAMETMKSLFDQKLYETIPYKPETC